MKNQKLRKVWSKRHLPSDLWPEILFRLPVKSLLRFRSVSKSWLALIDDAEFARLHLNNFRNNCDETHLLVVHNSRQNCVVRCIDTFETNSGRILTLGNESYPGGKWDIVCSVDGFILLRHGRSLDLKAWNPSIRKFREVPSLPIVEISPGSYLTYAAIGLGHDTLAKDYKLVILLSVNNNSSRTPHSVAIYILGANSWKITKSQGKGSSCSKWHWSFGSCSQGLYFQGCLYFITSVRDLIFFDLSSEMLSSITDTKLSSG